MLTGGSGADQFIFQSAADSRAGSRTKDIVTDFGRIDLIHLETIDANVNRRGDQDFRFIGEKAFSKAAGELQVEKGSVIGDVNGDGIADFVISVFSGSNWLAQLTADDFVL